MREISFVLNTTPTPQARPRHTVMNGFSRTYKTAAQKSNEATLDALLAMHAPETPIHGAVSLEFAAVFPVPASASKKKQREMLDGFVHHTHKPDLDNLTKQLKDAMTRLQFWQDDRQVVRTVCEKRYGERGQWMIRIREIEGGSSHDRGNTAEICPEMPSLRQGVPHEHPQQGLLLPGMQAHLRE